MMSTSSCSLVLTLKAQRHKHTQSCIICLLVLQFSFIEMSQCKPQVISLMLVCSNLDQNTSSFSNRVNRLRKWSYISLKIMIITKSLMGFPQISHWTPHLALCQKLLHHDFLRKILTFFLTNYLFKPKCCHWTNYLMFLK